MRNGGCKFPVASCDTSCTWSGCLQWPPSSLRTLFGSMRSILGEYSLFCYFVLYCDADEVQFFLLMISFAWCRTICTWHETNKIVKAFYLITNLDIILRYCAVIPQVIAKTNPYAYHVVLTSKEQINIDSLIDWPFQKIDTKWVLKI
jgi:hypothetical protein